MGALEVSRLKKNKREKQHMDSTQKHQQGSHQQLSDLWDTVDLDEGLEEELDIDFTKDVQLNNDDLQPTVLPDSQPM